MEQENNYQNRTIQKRNVAYRMRVGEILKGRPISNEGKFMYLELGNKKVVRVNIIANCVDKYIQEGEKQYATLTVDDASGQLRIKAFGEETEPIKKFSQGDTLQLIGNIREWNGEIYLLPEVIKAVDPRWLLARKLEIQKARKENPIEETNNPTNNELREKLINKIKEAETEGGIDKEKLLIEDEPTKIETEIKKLLEEGIIYEPRPGRIRYLG
jgi:RPA family protein